MGGTAAARQLNGTFGKEAHVVLLLCGGNVSLENLMEYQRQFSD